MTDETWWAEKLRTVEEGECPNRAEHTVMPEAYIEWHMRARQLGKTHRQVRCRGCGRFTIWVPKAKQTA